MSHRRFSVAALALVGVLLFPSVSRGSIIDFIWEMSGPQMIGLGLLHCRIAAFDQSGHKCLALLDTLHLSGPLGLSGTGAPNKWLSFESMYYFSTTKDSSANPYEAFHNHMLTFDPMFEMASFRPASGNWFLYHGAGVSYDVLFGSGFDTFDKFSVKFRPAGVMFKGLDVSYNMRFYPHGFTADEFGHGTRTTADRPSEWVWGVITVGKSW